MRMRIPTTIASPASPGRVVGITDERGKVAYDCHYSLTTAKHCSALGGVADVVVPCVSCAR